MVVAIPHFALLSIVPVVRVVLYRAAWLPGGRGSCPSTPGGSGRSAWS
ncbi:MAG: hypothetical protein IPL61_15825 [Myxococcales bacterium]|nr:hypothetical protein [Myxococcales bacterium]